MAIGLACEGEQRADAAIVFAADGNYLRYAAFAAAQIAGARAGAALRHLPLHARGRRAGRGPRRPRRPPRPGRHRRRLRPARASIRGAPRRPTCGWRCPRPSPAPTGGCSISTPTSSCRAATSARSSTSTSGRIRWPPCATTSSGAPPDGGPNSFRRLGLGPAPVFNSGVLLIDVAAFNAQDVLERCLAFGASHPPARIGLDQDLLNAVLHGGWAELSPVWNWQYTWASRLFEAMADAHVVHFIGPKKPWTHERGELPLRFRRAYRRFFAAHFPRRRSARTGWRRWRTAPSCSAASPSILSRRTR